MLFPRPVELFIKALIVYSVVTFLVEVDVYHSQNSVCGRPFFLWSERVVALLFTMEYFARWWKSEDRRRYPFSAMSVVDLVAIIPFYVGFFITGPWLGIIRALRVLRVVKLCRYNRTLQKLDDSIWKVRKQLLAVAEVVVIVIVLGSVLMHVVEGPQGKTFATIGNSAWWCFVTLTTVGYGDAYPNTGLGKVMAAVIMVVGLGIMGAFIGIFSSACADAINHDKE
jgi:voltage-gated potassium channel